MTKHFPFNRPNPIWQAPTGSIAVPELCAAICNAGGLGAIALSRIEPGEAAQRVRQAREATDKPFQVNFALAFPPHALDAALDAGVPVISFSWGNPVQEALRVRAAGASFGVQVTNVEGAKRALDLGADFLICQGIEAGGHVQSTTPLWDLLPTIVAEAGNVPVIASGGIGDGHGIAKALDFGASGAMLGTRFVATQESGAHPLYKERLIAATAVQTALTVCFDGSWPYAAHRVLRNKTLEEWEAAGCPPSGRRTGEGETVGLTAGGEPILRYDDTAPRAGMTGNIEEMCLYAGTSIEAVRDIPSAAEAVERLMREYQSQLAGR